MSDIFTEITEKIQSDGPSGFGAASLQFEEGSIEKVILNHDLKAYRKETGATHRWLPRKPHIVYNDADFCVFKLSTDEDEPLQIEDSYKHAPAWWVLGRDSLRDCGLVLMEFPKDEIEDNEWTRSRVLEALDLDSWLPLGTEEATELPVGERRRLCGRLAIERHDPDDWIERHNESGIEVDWDYLEQHRDISATRMNGHLLTFDDAADVGRTFDPTREGDSHPLETAYIPEGATMLTHSDHFHNRKLTFSEGVYEFRLISKCRHHTAVSPIHRQDRPWFLSATSG